ncbi:MAG: hypothetical protein ACRD0Y_10215, partial [Terriglobales bacterium]
MQPWPQRSAAPGWGQGPSTRREHKRDARRSRAGARACQWLCFALAICTLTVGLGACRQAPAPALAFTVTPQPGSHNFHVVFRSAGGNAELEDFTMPVWMPGYYGLMHYARFVSHFAAQDGQGHTLG